MKNIGSLIFPVILILLGGALLVAGAKDGQNTWVLLGAGLAMVAGVVALLMQLGIMGRKGGAMVGIVFAVLAVLLAYRNYRSVAEDLEFAAAKKRNDRLVIQALKDLRSAQIAYREANGAFAGDLKELQRFIKEGRITKIRAIGQVPDTLTEKDALALGIITRDTILVPALDSTFFTRKALENRLYPFDPDSFIYSPVSRKPFLLAAGSVTSSGRNVPVFLAKDPTPMINRRTGEGDTLMVGSLEKAITAGNWAGE
jgi:hypothetical protein